MILYFTVEYSKTQLPFQNILIIKKVKNVENGNKCKQI